jgi:hypothetical protein
MTKPRSSRRHPALETACPDLRPRYSAPEEQRARMDQPLRVFVSSTFYDLKEYREAALTSILSLGGIAEDMVFWPASERDATSFSLDRVRKSDVVICIVAHRYGHIPPGSEYSVTELEYREARAVGIPVLPFLVDDTIAWRVSHVDWEHAKSIAAFKALIKSQNVVAHFRSLDHLARLITEALVGLISERTGVNLARCFESNVSVRRPVARTHIPSQPDVAIHIGRSEDGLPLVLDVNRSDEIAAFFEEFEASKPDFRLKFPSALVDDLKSSLAGPTRLQNVKGLDGRVRLTYVAHRNLADTFRSVFAELLQVGREVPLTRPAMLPARLGAPKDECDTDSNLESAGGSNRFLGLPIDGDELQCVGRLPSGWVEWRPFRHESIPHNFPDARFRIGTTSDGLAGSISSYPEAIFEYALDAIGSDGTLAAPVGFEISRASIATIIVKAITCLLKHHESIGIHGDIKPSNILLTENGPCLIDSLEVEPGQVCPGWTPDWSAPEQVLGEPASLSADTYAVGRLLTELVGASLVGETRQVRFRPGRGKPLADYDMYHNPVLDFDGPVTVERAVRHMWAGLIKRCLRFAPTERPPLLEVLGFLHEVLRAAPLQGHVTISATGKLVAVAGREGGHIIARSITDGVRKPPRAARQGETITRPVRSDKDATVNVGTVHKLDRFSTPPDHAAAPPPADA